MIFHSISYLQSLSCAASTEHKKHNPRFACAPYTGCMTDRHHTILTAGLHEVQERLLELITQPKSEKDPPDKWAKTYSALMKAEADATARLAEHDAKTAAKHHTRYEDMPPPTPEDEERFYARFRKLVGLVNDPDADARAMVLAERLGQGDGLGGLADLEDG